MVVGWRGGDGVGGKKLQPPNAVPALVVCVFSALATETSLKVGNANLEERALMTFTVFLKNSLSLSPLSLSPGVTATSPPTPLPDQYFRDIDKVASMCLLSPPLTPNAESRESDICN